METIRFVNKESRNFAAAVRKNVNAYFREKGISTKGDSRMIVKAAVMLSMYFAPFIVMLAVPMSGWLMFPLAILMGMGMAGIGMAVMHDAAHGSFSRSGRLNKILNNTAFMLGGNVFTWKVQHNLLHHTFTNIDGFDEDIDSKIVFRFSKQTPLKKIHRFQHLYAFFFYSLMTISMLVRDFFRLYEYNKSGITRQQKAKPRAEYAKMIISKVLYVGVFIGLPIWLSSFSWWLVLLGFLITHLTAGVIMSIVFQLAHLVEKTDMPVPCSKGTIENEWAVHELNTTCNFSKNSRIMSWFIGGLNYQIEHHLFPDICHVHYPKIAPIVEKTVKEFGLRYNVQRTFFHAVVSHLRVLKSLGRNVA